ncbi:MAG: hypothetical protein ABFS86_14400 [Planctomycetota bacterium]
MSKPSFIKRILSLGKNEESLEPAAETAVATDAGSADPADRPSITEILFRRSGPPPHDGESGGGAGVEVENAPAVVPERKISKKEETAQKISEGFDDLSGLLKNIGEKLETGNERNQTLNESIEGLPAVLDAIPETNRAQIEFLNTISKQLDMSNRRSGEIMEQFSTLPAILESIPASQEQQSNQLKTISRLLSETTGNQLEFMEKTEKRQGEVLESFQTAQKRSLNMFHNAQQESLAAYQQSQEQQSEQLSRLVEHTNRSMTRVLITCAAIVGVAMCGVAAIFFLG